MRVAAILVPTLALAACNISADAREGDEGAAGPSVQRSFEVGSFDAISLEGPYDVVVRVGPAASVRAEGDAKEIGRMEIKVRNGELEIGRERGSGWMMGFRRRRAPVTVYVTAPALRAAQIAGSGDMTIDKVEGRSFEADIAGSGDMKIASLRVEEARFDIAGSGDIAAAGTAREAHVSVAGSGNVDLAGLEAQDAQVEIVGSGDVRTRAMATADVSITGSGDVFVSGPAKCSVSKMGSGEVHCES